MNRYSSSHSHSSHSYYSSTASPSAVAGAPTSQLFYEELVFPYCEDVTNYDKLTKIGQGTFG